MKKFCGKQMCERGSFKGWRLKVLNRSNPATKTHEHEWKGKNAGNKHFIIQLMHNI